MQNKSLQKFFNWLLTLSAFAWTIWQALTTFETSYLRLGEAFYDFGLSIKFFFCLLLGIPNYTMPTVNNFSDVMPWRLIPEEWAAFWASVADYFGLLFQGSNLKAYGDTVMGVTETVAKAGLVLLPCVLILAVAVKQLYRSGNTKHNQDTVPLTLFKRYAQAYYQPIKRFVLGYIDFIRERFFIVVILSLIWVCSLNIVAIVVVVIVVISRGAVDCLQDVQSQIQVILLNHVDGKILQALVGGDEIGLFGQLFASVIERHGVEFFYFHGAYLLIGR